MKAPVAHYGAITGARRYLAPRSEGARLHAGVDLLAQPGTPVVAPEDGAVLLAYPDADHAPSSGGWAWQGYGPAIVLLHGASGVYHLLAHLATLPLIHAGDVVHEGQQLGVVSALHHCHWEVRSMPHPPQHASEVEITCNPLTWLAGSPVLYDPTRDGCPTHPGGTYRTPWACRPGNAGRPPPYTIDPFPKAR